MTDAPNPKPRRLTDLPLPPEVRQRFQQLQVSRRFTRDPEVVRRVLVRAPNWVGDAVMSLPVLAGLKRLFPLADVTVLAAPRVAPLFAAQPGVTGIIRYPSDRGKWQVLWELRGRFDVALALPNSMESALGLWLVGVPSRVGYNTDARRLFLKEAVSGHDKLAGLHTVFYLLGLLKALGGVATFTPPTLYLEPEEEVLGAQLLAESDLPGRGPWVGLSPGAAYGPAKRWPAERFAALGRELQREFGARLVLLGGDEERPVADEVREQLPGPVADLVGRTSLRQALGVLSQLNLLVTNDSGLMHAAAALSVPLVALFGSTDPTATGPFTSRATVIRHPQPCSPCFKRTCETGYACLTDISVDEVTAAARSWLKAGA
jgi:heptosyltransferase-2